MTKLDFRQALMSVSMFLALGCVAPPAIPLQDGGEEDAGHDAGKPVEMFSCSPWQPAFSEVLDGGLIHLETGGGVSTFAVSDNRDQIAYQVQEGTVVVRDFEAGTELKVTTKRSLAAIFGTRLSASWVMLSGRDAKYQRFNFETCALDGPAINDSSGGPNPSDDVTRDSPAMSGPYWSWTSNSVLGRDLSIVIPGAASVTVPDTEVRVYNASLVGSLALWQATNSVVGHPFFFRFIDLSSGWNTEREIVSHGALSDPHMRVSAGWTVWVDSPATGTYAVHALETAQAHDAGIIDLASGSIRPMTLALKNGVVAWAETLPTPVLAWSDLNIDGGVQRQPTPMGFAGMELHSAGLVYSVDHELYIDPSFKR